MSTSEKQLEIKPWPLLESRPAADYRVFKVRVDRKINPRTGSELDFFVLDAVPWVNVIALTEAGELIMVEQYRHGTNTVELEVPGGVMDPEDGNPIVTGLRELREETGYAGDAGELIGQVAANPAIMSNTCYTVLVKNCRRVGNPTLDPGEDLATRLHSLDEIHALIKSGRIQHSLVVAALFHYQLSRRENHPTA